MGIFDGIEDTKITNKTPSLAGGTDGGFNTYRVRVTKIEKGLTSIKKAEFFRARFVIESSEGAGANPAGTEAELFVEKRQYDYHLKEIGAFVAALIADPSTKLTAKVVEELTADDQPAAGEEVMVRVRNKPGKTYGDGTPITELHWMPVVPPSVTEVAKATTTKSKTK